jgi:prevent-host-death family protein
MTLSYSIAEARNQFAALIRRIEKEEQMVQVTRRGEPVAIILSQEEYERLMEKKPKEDFWEAYLAWREEWQVDTWEDDTDPFADVRDRSPGREINVWE